MANFFFQVMMEKMIFEQLRCGRTKKKSFGIGVLSVTGENVLNDDEAFQDFKSVFQNEKVFNGEYLYKWTVLEITSEQNASINRRKRSFRAENQ